MLQRAQAQRVETIRVRRPAVPLAVLLLLGVLSQHLLPPWPGTWLGCIAGLVVAGWLTRRRDLTCCTCLAAALLLAGVTAGQLESSFYPPAEIGLFCSADRQLAQLELTLDDPPRLSAPPKHGQRPTPPSQFTRATVRRILTTDGWRPATGTLLAHIEPPDPHLRGGETLRATGWLQQLSPPMNPGQFDFAAHYRAERVLGSFSIRRAENLTLLSGPPNFAPIAWLRARSRALLDAGFSDDAHATDHALLRALLLGDNDPLLRDIQDLFIRTGTSHHLSISGLHVAVLTWFVYLLCRLSRLAPRTTAAVTLTFVVLYAAAALPNPPVVRAVLLCLCAILGLLARRTPDLIQLLAIAVFAMLAYAPLDVYDVGFELSFGTVLGLMLFTRPLTEALFPVDPDLALAPKQKPSRLRAWINWFGRSTREACVAAVVAWFVSLPMILHHFDRLNPWATLASILLAPIVFLSLIFGLLKICLTLLCPPLAATWATLAILPTTLMRHGVESLARLPGSDVTLRPIPVPVMLLYYAALAAALLPSLSKRVRRSLVITAGTTALLLPILLTCLSSRHPAETRVTVLSVGAGSCAVVETDAGQTLLLDAGSTGSSDLYRGVIEPFFRGRALRRIDAAFVSHADFDHYGAVADIARQLGIGRTYVTPQFRRDSADSPTAAGMLRTLATLHCPVESLVTPRSIRLSPDTTLDVLWPPADGQWSTNDSSMVLRLTVAGHSILFPGDLQSDGMRGVMSAAGSLKTDVLIAPHHGSFEDATPDFVQAASPTWIISSDDSTPSGKQRTFDETFADLHPLHTHTSGAVTITIRRDGSIAVEPFLHPSTH